MELTSAFRRPLPTGRSYADRFAREMRLVEQNNFKDVFLQVRSILDLVPEFRYVTRGSAGCSLIGYLLGIHNMDPVEHGFALSRFMHEGRLDLPDVDLDFAYNQRDEVIRRVMLKYPGRVARISNHVTYKSTSAIRQALREIGLHRFLPKGFNLKDVVGDRSDEVLNRAAEIVGDFKNYSLHCGGIVIFPDSVPEELKLNDFQIKLNKDEVEDHKLFKIDILCNRGLAQLNELSNRPLENYPADDEATAKIFSDGCAWGVNFGESPAQRKLHVELQPKCRDDIIFSLALIRPLPSADGKRMQILRQLRQHGNYLGQMVYDDDGIFYIRDLLNCSESEAELYRNAFSKKKYDKIAEFIEKTKYHPNQAQIVNDLNRFSLYSFCRAHAVNYGQLVWALAYEKAHQPFKFWCSVLNHAESMYRPWVHVQEAKAAGLVFGAFGKGPWKLDGNVLTPSIVEERGKGLWQYNRRGYWISEKFMPGCFCERNGNQVKFRGLIATGRHHGVDKRKITFMTVGYDTGKYLELVLNGYVHYSSYDFVEGEGSINSTSVKVNNFRLHKAPKISSNSKQ
jgi:DNA polymerase III alpha subunit